MKSATKNHILQVASRLFFTEGLATGIDRIPDECCTAKMTIGSDKLPPVVVALPRKLPRGARPERD